MQYAGWRRAAALLGVCLALAALASSAELHQALLHLLRAVEGTIDRNPAAGMLVFVAVAAVSAMLAFVSVAIIVPAAVLAWGEPLSLLLLWIGWTLGGVFSYLLGRFIGRPAARWLGFDHLLQNLEHQVQRDAAFWFVLLLQLALPSEVLGYAMGAARYPLSRYLLVLSLAELPYSIATVALGAGFLEQRGGSIIMVGIGIAAVSLGALYGIRRKTRPREG